MYLFQERDIERTVGINTGHIGTADFTLEPADRDFAVGVSLLSRVLYNLNAKSLF